MNRRPTECLRVFISLDAVFAIRKLNFLLFDSQIRTEYATCDFATILAVADMASSLSAEEVVIVDLDHNGFAKTGTFHVVIEVC